MSDPAIQTDNSLGIHVTLAHAGFELVVNENVEASGVTAVFGASGAGKSTLLRAVAGLDAPAAGNIRWCGRPWYDSTRGVNVAAHRRPVGYLFQDARLFAHLNVSGNLAYAQRRRRGAERIGRADVIEALDLAALLPRAVTGLSGGERQRVALGRTLLTSPDLLLLDEPLAALDGPRKAEILPYLARVTRQFRIPTLYVSHDVDEVAQLCDRMLVLANGRVLAHDNTAAVLERLDLTPITGRFEAGVLMTGTLARHDERLHLSQVDIGGNQYLTMPLRRELAPGASVRLRIRARDVALATLPPEGLSIRNVLSGELAELEVDTNNGLAEALVHLPGAHVRARLTLAAVEALGLKPGMRVHALIKSVSLEGST